ncbi:diguanylate cyclase [Variovorax ginsengisoli]|uniref:Diguanylate cyclase (GGDEF)-like protein n=1 Tax=Variovorax ginsengisoli TaxID=363844 RepID=A0ABT9S2R1_9BURK|nr:diguanylate cyclase [Variovorax ginsengisoli]MDP9898633.1 diguanylate cyclase (GGDEF)-like protein [Variovorax ginsengisoli]
MLTVHAAQVQAQSNAAPQAAVSEAARAPALLSRQPQGQLLVDHLQLFEDPTRALSIEQVRTPAQEARFAYPDNPLVGRESDRVLWFKLQLRLANPADTSREWLLLVPTVSTHELRFYGPYDTTGKALAPPVTTGMRHPWSTRPAASEQMAWRFQLPDPGVYTVYFRVDSTFARIYAVSAWDTADYLQSTQDKRMFDGVSYGLLLGLLVYGLVLLLVFGEGIYLYFLLSCMCALMALAGFNGHVLRYLFPHWPTGAGIAYILAPALWAICKLQFGRKLLRLRHFAPRLDQVVRLMLIALGAAAVYALWGPHPLWMFRLVQLAVVVSTAVLLVGAVVAVRGRYWPAVLYCIGVALLFIGICAIIVASWGWIAWTPDQINVTQAALIAELVVFAVAMASRLRLMLRSEQALTARTQQLVEALGTDALTGIASRVGLEGPASIRIREGKPFSLMLLDLDGFKSVNDTHGHAAGDAVLVAVGQRLQRQVRQGDIVARLGGDEFAVLVAGRTSRETLADLALRLVKAGERPVDYEGRTLSVGLSLGIACHPDDGHTMPLLLRAADRAMYHCKQQRTGPSFAFASDLPASTSDRPPLSNAAATSA